MLKRLRLAKKHRILILKGLMIKITVKRIRLSPAFKSIPPKSIASQPFVFFMAEPSQPAIILTPTSTSALKALSAHSRIFRFAFISLETCTSTSAKSWLMSNPVTYPLPVKPAYFDSTKVPANFPPVAFPFSASRKIINYPGI